VKRTIITILFLLICIRTIAFDFSRTSPTGQVLYYNIDEQTTTVIVTAPVSNTIGASYIGYEKPAGELIIPNIVEYNGVHYVVKAIENNAFSNCMNLKSVTISDSITIIGNEAFKGCSNLREVKIGTKLQKIGVSAFLSCRKLQKINLPNSIIEISKHAFSNCISLEQILLPDNLNKIESYAFARSLIEYPVRALLKSVSSVTMLFK
jgi:hypothetical protein